MPKAITSQQGKYNNPSLVNGVLAEGESRATQYSFYEQMQRIK